MLLGDFRYSSNWMQNLAQKITFAKNPQTLINQGSRTLFVVLAKKPQNVRFSRPSIGVSRFSMKNIRWAEARCLGRGETGITHKTFCDIKYAKKTSCSLGMYRYTYEASGAKRSDLQLSGTFISRFLDFGKYYCLALVPLNGHF